MKSFFSKKIVVGALVTATVCVSGITDAKAQEFAVQGDIVSSYVWRECTRVEVRLFNPRWGLGSIIFLLPHGDLLISVEGIKNWI